MTNFAIISEGLPIDLPPGDIVTNDVTHSRQILGLWTLGELATIGIYPVQEETIPAGKVSTGSTLQFVNGIVSRVHTLEDAPPPPPPPVPEEISDRQFAQQLAILGVITQEQAIAWAARGDLPPAMNAAVDALPDDGTRFAAKMMLASATIYRRSHPMTAALGVILGWTDAQLDSIWRAAAVL